MTMPLIESGAPGIRPIDRQQMPSGPDSIHRRDDGSSGGFRPQTNVSLRTAIRDMAATLGKIGVEERFGIQKLPQEVGDVVRNILRQSLSVEATLARGIGSTIESQRFSADQLMLFSRMLMQVGTLVEKGYSMELSDETQALLSNLKATLVAREGGEALEPVLMSKASFELLDSKTAEQLPQALYEVLSQLATAPSAAPQTQPPTSDSFQFLKQLVKFFMPRPGVDIPPTDQQPQTQSPTQRLLQSMFKNFGGQPTSTPQAQPTSTNVQPQVQPTSTTTVQPQVQPQPTSTNVQPQGQQTVQPQAQPTSTNVQPQPQPQPQPTSTTTVQPQSQPQPQPTSTTNVQPQSQPQPTSTNVQPQAQPQSQPTSTTTVQPQSQPTSTNVQPQSQPTSTTNVQPQAQQTSTTVQPQAQQTSTTVQPQAQQTSTNVQPQAQPQSQPTSTTVQPQAQPQSQPTSTTVQPQSQPQSQPTSTNVQPQSQPQAQPTSTTVQSQVQPQGQQTVQPQAQQTSTTTVQPQSQPQSQPTSTTTVQPQSQPTSTTTVQPQAQPTSTNVQPQAQPTSTTVQPQSQPQSQPTSTTVQPQAQPTSTTTVQPQAQLQAQPTSTTVQPQAQQTVQPQAQPQSQPTSTTTVQPQPQPQPTSTTVQPQAQPQAQPTSTTTVQPQSQPTSTTTVQPTAVNGDFIARQMEMREQMDVAKTMLLRQPLQNAPQTTDALKDLAQFLLRNSEMSPRETVMLQNFVNNTQKMMPEAEARHLQNLLRLCQQNVPLTVQQAAVQQDLPDLPRLWAFMQLCDMANLTSKMNARAFKRAGKDVADFATAMTKAMSPDNSVVQNQRTFQMMMPLYIGENERSYPTYLSVYDEKSRDADGNEKKETWLRLCVLTDHIGAAELIFRIYDKSQLDMRFYFSRRDIALEFGNLYVNQLKHSLKDMPLNIGEIRIGAVGERMASA